MTPILRTENLSIGYKNNCIANNITLDAKTGITAIIGRNGAGKSTLIKTLTGHIPSLEGTILINDCSIKNLKKRELSKLISIVTTDISMAGGLKLHELVGLGRTPYTGRMGILTQKDNDIIDEAIQAVGMMHKKDSFVAELSDGERQRGMIAKGLVQETPIIIMDEPFSFLDVAARLEMYELTRKLADERGKTIIFSSHEVSEVLNVADKLWVFTHSGVKTGTTKNLIDNGIMDQIFDCNKVIFDRNTKKFKLKQN